MSREIDAEHWERLLRAVVAFHAAVGDAVLVGGSAAILHAGHRLSGDADHVLPNLRERYESLLDLLEHRDDWVTARVAPGKQILGSFQGIETGLRQLIRARPLEVETVETPYGPVRVPTLAEMLRVKAWLVLKRNATRDYIDVAALSDRAGADGSWDALRDFDDYYRDVYRPDAGRDVSPLLQLSRQLAEPKPHDLARTEVASYKGLDRRWRGWDGIAAQCARVAVGIETGLARQREI